MCGSSLQTLTPYRKWWRVKFSQSIEYQVGQRSINYLFQELPGNKSAVLITTFLPRKKSTINLSLLSSQELLEKYHWHGSLQVKLSSGYVTIIHTALILETEANMITSYITVKHVWALSQLNLLLIRSSQTRF